MSGRQIQDVRAVNEQKAQYLTFTLGKEEYGVDILRVQEIRGWETVTRIPNVPEHVKGVLNLRGAIVPIMELRGRFKLPSKPVGKETVVIVLRTESDAGERIVGVVVDAVADVHDADKTDMRNTPEFGERVMTEYISSLATVGDKMIMLLDVDKLLAESSDPCSASVAA